MVVILLYCVYKHTSPSEKVYIGITCKNPLQRWKCGNGYKNNTHFYNAIVKYGWDNFRHEILFDGLTKEEACQKEIELIAKYKSNNSGFGYNVSTGGECHAKGCKWTNEHKQKTSNSLKGHSVSLETKEKIKKARLKQQNVKNPPVHIGANNNKSKRVVALNKNGDIIAAFDTVAQAAKCYNVCHQSISDCCKGKLKSVKKTIFRYECEVKAHG